MDLHSQEKKITSITVWWSGRRERSKKWKRTNVTRLSVSKLEGRKRERASYVETGTFFLG